MSHELVGNSLNATYFELHPPHNLATSTFIINYYVSVQDLVMG